jgi:hypothetical protein
VIEMYDGMEPRLRPTETSGTDPRRYPGYMARRPRQPVSDPGRDEKISLAPLTAEEALKALLRTPPPSNGNGETRAAEANDKK